MKILHRLASVALVLWMVLYVPMILAVTAGMGYAAYRLTIAVFGSAFASGRSSHYLSLFHVLSAVLVVCADLAVLGVSMLLLFGLLGLLFRPVAPSGGLLLPRSEHHTLYELIDRLCKRLGARTPDAVYLTPFEDTGVSDRPVVDEDGTIHKRSRVLELGAALIVHLRADEFTTILCHEIAHASMGDTRLGPLAGRFFNSMSETIKVLLDDPSPLEVVVAWPLNAYYRTFALLYLLDSRRREFRADRISAEVCGPQNARNALMKVHLPSYLPQLSIRTLLAEYSQNERDVRNIYQEHRDRWQAVPAAVLERAQSQMFLEPGSIWSTHPRLAKRMRNVSQVTAKELSIDKPAQRLFAGWERLEEFMTHVLISVGRELFERHLNALDRELRSQPRR